MSAQPPLRLTDEEAAVIDAIRGTAFGAIEVIVHQQRIVQVVRSEKTRFDSPHPRPTRPLEAHPTHPPR
jgi:hypothetical protein